MVEHAKRRTVAISSLPFRDKMAVAVYAFVTWYSCCILVLPGLMNIRDAALRDFGFLPKFGKDRSRGESSRIRWRMFRVEKSVQGRAQGAGAFE